jgi:gliding motility-associated-like protein
LSAKRISVLLLFFLVAIAAHAQKVTTFQTVYGGSKNDQGIAMLTTADGGFISICYTESYGAGGSDILVLRTDSLGRVLWTKTYGGTKNESISISYTNTLYQCNIVQVKDSNYVLCSQTKSYGSGGNDIYLIKIDKYGKVIWSRTIGGSADDAAYNIKVLADGGLIVVGQTNSYGKGGLDVFVVRTNDTGGVVWANAYGTSVDDAGFGLKISRDSSILISGYTESNKGDILVLKLDLKGKLSWTRVLGGPRWDFTYGMEEDESRRLYLSGQTESHTSSGDLDYYLVKLDSAGHVIWGKNYGTSSREGGRDIILDSSNILRWIGWTNNSKIAYLRLDTAGALKFAKWYGTSGKHPIWFFNQIQSLPDNGTGIIAATDGAGSGNNDIYFFKLDGSGNTNGCNSGSLSFSSSTYKPTVYSLTINKSSAVPSVSSGVTVKTVTVSTTEVCYPFIANFTWQNACKGASVQFEDSTYKNAKKWSWSFADTASSSNISTSQNPTHTFKYSGTYTVRLIAGNGTNVDTITKKVTIYDYPKGSLKGPSKYCTGDSVTLSATGGKTYRWRPSRYFKDTVSATVKAKFTARTKYYVDIVGPGGCYITDSITIDTFALTPPVLQCVSTSSDSSLVLSWKLPSDTTGVGSYVVKSTKPGGSTFTFSDTVALGTSGITYSHGKLTGSVQFKVFALARCGQSGSKVSSLSSLFLRDSLLDDKTLLLTASVPAGNWWYLEKDGGSGFKILDSSQSPTYRIHQCSFDGKFRAYRKGTGCKGYSNIVTTQWKDSTPPGPSGFLYGTVASDSKITLRIKRNLTADLQYYKIYIWTNDTGFSLEATLDAAKYSSSEFNLDITKLDTRHNRYCFGLQLLDSCGNASKVEKICLPELQALAINKAVELNWHPYIDVEGNDTVSKYTVERSTNGSSWVAASSKLTAADTAFTDTNVICNTLYYYRINVTLKSGISSGIYSDTTAVKTFNHDTPATPEMMNASVLFSGGNYDTKNWFRWKVKKTAEYRFYYAPMDSTTVIYHGSMYASGAPKKDSIFPDTYGKDVGVGKGRYCFYVRLVDSCGNYSGLSPRHCPVFLIGKAESNLFHFTWDKYIGYKVGKQVLERKAGSNWQAVMSADSNITSFTDTNLECGSTYIYRLVSYRYGGSGNAWDSTLSNEVTLKAFDTTTPAKVVMRLASIVDAHIVKVVFNVLNERNTSDYKIYYSKNGGSFKLLTTVSRPDSSVYSGSFYSTDFNTLSDTLRFYVIGYNSCDKKASLLYDVHRPVQLFGSNGQYRVQLVWSAYEAFTVKKYHIQRLKGNKWATIQNLSGSTVEFIDSLLPCNIPQYYRIQSESTTGEFSFSDTLQLTPFDTVRPLAPSIRWVSVDDEHSITLNFGPSPSSDVVSYRIYRSSRNFWQLVGITSKQQFTDTTVHASDSVYCYKVVALDSCAGNLSDGSTVHCTSLLHAKVKDCEHSIYLSWNQYHGWDSIRSVQLWRTADGSSASLLRTFAPPLDSAFRDTLLDPHISYIYYLVFQNYKGDSSKSNTGTDMLFLMDTPQVILATKLNSSATSGSILIRWEKPAQLRHLAYYNLYYRPDASSSFSLLQKHIPITQDSFIHKNIDTRSGRQSYRIGVEDSCGNESDFSPAQKVMDLEVTVGQLIHRLHWSPYSGFKVKNYVIQRREGNTFVDIDTVAATDTTYEKFPAPCNYTIHYRILAIGASAGQWSYSDTMGRIAIDTIPAASAQMMNLSVTDTAHIELTFKASPTADVYAYAIQRRSGSNAWFTAAQIVSDKSQSYYVFTDTVNTLIQSYCYRVLTLDSCLNATSSDTFCSIWLQGRALNEGVTLRFSVFNGYDVSQYALQRLNNDGITWDTLRILNYPDTFYIDSPLTCNIPRQYRVAGMENTGSGGRITFSDPVIKTPFDTLAPPAPVILRATVVDSKNILLEWLQSTDIGTKDYEISYRNMTDTLWHTEGIVRDTFSYIFTTLNPMDSAYQFRLRAIDSCARNISSFSPHHSPVELHGQPQQLSNHLIWKEYTGFPVSIYRIYEWKGSWQKLDSVNGNTFEYIHSGLPCNVLHFYRIEAQSETSALVSLSDSQALKPFDTIAPAAPLLRYVSVRNSRSIAIGWKWDNAFDVKYFDVWRQNGSGSFIQVATVIYDSVFVDTTARPASFSYRYFIIARDSCSALNRSLPSDTGNIIRPVAATGACFPEVRLSWNTSFGLPGGAKAYRIERSENGKPFIELTVLNAGQLAFTDTTVEENIKYIYRIRSLSTSSSEWSLSDTLSIYPSIIPLPDSTRILITTIERTSFTDGAVRITWKKYALANDTFARGYRVYYSQSGLQGSYGMLYETNDLGDTVFTHHGINTSSAHHFYTVSVFNLCHRDGNLSGAHSPVNLELAGANLRFNLNWSRYSGQPVSQYVLYRSANGKSYVPYAKLTDTFYTDSLLRCGLNYSYRIESKLANGFSSWSDSVIAQAYDTIAPPSPEIVFASVDTAAKNKITLVFQGNRKPSRNGYLIYSRQGGTWLLTARIYDTASGIITFTDSTYKATAPGSYYILAADSCGNISDSLSHHTTIFLRALAYSGYIQCNWSFYEGWSGGPQHFTLFRRDSGSSWTPVFVGGRGSSSFADSHVVCHHFYEYMLLAGRDTLLTYSNTAGDTAFENVSPDAPQLLYVTVNNTGTTTGAVKIRWIKPLARDVKYYRLYRRDPSSRTLLAGTLPPDVFTFTDSFLNTSAYSYSYELEAVDSCSNVSLAASSPHSSILLKASGGMGSFTVSWSAYKGWPAKYYILERNDVRVDSIGVTDPLQQQFYYEDTLAICGVPYYYRVKAISLDNDTIYSWSNYSDTLQLISGRKLYAPYLRSATVSTPNTEATITWDPPTSGGAGYYNIWKNENGTLRMVGTTATLSWVDKDLNENGGCYFIQAVNLCGEKSELSNAGCLMMLKGTAGSLTNSLFWNSYSHWPDGVASYNVYRNLDSAGWELIGSSLTPLFSDTALGEKDTRQFCYKVEALQNAGPENSYSTEICLRQQPIVFMPNVFTPFDRNRLNDSFKPLGRYIGHYQLYIYNRWGERIYTGNDKAWDGTFNGKDVPEGVYLYMVRIEALDKQATMLKGNVMLLPGR